MASSNITLPNFTSNFLGKTHHILSRPIKPNRSAQRHQTLKPPCAKFNLFEIMGGRGLCNGEAGLINELAKPVEYQDPPAHPKAQESGGESESGLFPEDGFDKELSGLTGGFPGGEKGLRLFVEKNPPPKKPAAEKMANTASLAKKKPKPPELPLLLPGMIAIVKNPNNPYYMYTGIVQRITDGKAGVLFEGGNWDHLISFQLNELERRDKGPPGKNPLSAILEPYLQNDSQ